MYTLLPAIPRTPRSGDHGPGETCIVYRCLIILRNVFSGPEPRKYVRGRRLQNFIVYHSEINNKTDFNFFFSLALSLSRFCIIFIPSLKAGGYFSICVRASFVGCICICVCVCVYVCVASVYKCSMRMRVCSQFVSVPFGLSF